MSDIAAIVDAPDNIGYTSVNPTGCNCTGMLCVSQLYVSGMPGTGTGMRWPSR